MKLFKKLFLSGDWNISIYKEKQFIKIKPQKGYWYADPFIVNEQGTDYIFVEAFNKKKEIGYLGYICSQDNFHKLRLILKEKVHLSFPNLFKIQNSYFLIPESSESKSIDLYSFDNFPNKITKIKKLLTGDFVDTCVLYREDDKIFFGTYENTHKTLFVFSLDVKTWDTKILHEISDPNRMYRPAGNAFLYNSELYVPFQMCTNKYGEKIKFYKYDKNSKTLLSEVNKSIDKNTFSQNLQYDRIHTINFINENFFVFDYMKEKFSLLKPFKMAKRKIRRKVSSKKNG